MTTYTYPSARSDVVLREYVSTDNNGGFDSLLWHTQTMESDDEISTDKATKILYIEDDLNNALLMKRILEADGYSVSIAPSGKVGLNKAHQEHPDLILLDIYMPGLNGHEVARRLREMDDTKNTPILVISASPNSDDKRLSKAMGCNGYIGKPIDVDRISSQVAAYLGMSSK